MARLKLPEQRHLRRVADAAAGLDSGREVFVLVELGHNAPFAVEVFDDETGARAALATKNRAAEADSRANWWYCVPARGEKTAFRSSALQRQVNVIWHDWWSPLFTKAFANINRDEAEFTLLIKNTRTGETVPVPLTDEVRKQNREGQVDAIFLSFEAVDKFVIPHLHATYGAYGAWKMRSQLKNQLGDGPSDLERQTSLEIRSRFEAGLAEEPSPDTAISEELKLWLGESENR